MDSNDSNDEEGADNVASWLGNRHCTYPRRRRARHPADETGDQSDHEYLGGNGYTEESRRTATTAAGNSTSEGASSETDHKDDDHTRDCASIQKLGLYITSSSDDDDESQRKSRERIQKFGLNVFHLLVLPYTLGYNNLPIRAVQMTRNGINKEKGTHLAFDEVWTAMVGQITQDLKPPDLPLNKIRKEYWKQLKQFVQERFSQIQYNVKEKTWQMRKSRESTAYKTSTYQYHYHMEDEEIQTYSEFSDYTCEHVQRIISGLASGDRPCLGNGDGKEALAAIFLLARAMVCDRTFNRTVLDHCIVKNRGGGAIETTPGSANLVLYTYMADGPAKQAKAFLNKKSKTADGYIKGCVPNVQLCKLVDEECWPIITGEVMKSTNDNPPHHDDTAVREGIQNQTENGKPVSLKCWAQALVGLENDRQEKSYGVHVYPTELHLYQLHYQESGKIATVYKRYPLADEVVDKTKETKYMKFNSQNFVQFLQDIAAIVHEEFPAE